MNYTGINIGSVCTFYVIPITKIQNFSFLTAHEVVFSLVDDFELISGRATDQTPEPGSEIKDSKYAFTANGEFYFNIPKVDKTSLQLIESYIGIPIIIYMVLANEESFVIGCPNFPLRLASAKHNVFAQINKATTNLVKFEGVGAELRSATLTA